MDVDEIVERLNRAYPFEVWTGTHWYQTDVYMDAINYCIECADRMRREMRRDRHSFVLRTGTVIFAVNDHMQYHDIYTATRFMEGVSDGVLSRNKD